MLLEATIILSLVLVAPYIAYLGYYVLKNLEPTYEKDYEYEPSVTVVVPTYNEESIVQKKLEDIVQLDYPTDKIEILFVDSSDDDTLEKIRKWMEMADGPIPEVNIIREEERAGLAVALNMAYEEAKHDIIVKTDCDSKIGNSAVREAVAILADDTIGAVTGSNTDVLGGSAVEEGYRNLQSYIQTLETAIDSTFIFHGPFSVFEKQFVQPIDEDSLADDTELAMRIRKQDLRVVYDSDIKYKEAAHSAFRERRQQKDRRAMGLLRLLWRERDTLFRYGNYGRVVIPFNWWFMVISPILCHILVLFYAAVSFSLFGIFGITVFTLLYIGFNFLGQRDQLSHLQPLYSFYDTQISLLVAMGTLVTTGGDGTWEVDSALREHY